MKLPQQHTLSRRRLMQSLPLWLGLAAASTDSSSAASSDTPEWMEHVTRRPPGKYANLRAVSLEYTFDWNHQINAGRAGISILREPDKKSRLIGDATGQSTGFARLLYPYNFEAKSVVDVSTMRPISYQISEKERGDQNSYDIVFEKKRQIYTATSVSKGKTYSKTGRFAFDHGYDGLSSAFYLRGQPLEKGEEITMVVTPFNRPYLASFVVVGRETHKVKGTQYDAIKLEAKIGKVNADLSITPYDRVKRTTLWFSDDEYRIPLEMQSQLTFGFVSARLDRLEWLE